MSSSSKRSRLAILSIIIALIGIILAALSLFKIGLTFIFIAALLMAGSFTHSRLQKLGAEAWALGSIFVWIGYLLFSLPVLGFAWGIYSTKNRVFLFLGGIFLIIIGFTTEYYDLNVKFLRFWNNTKKKFNLIIKRFNLTFFSSFWTGISTGLILFLLLTFITPQIMQPISLIFHYSINSQRYGILFLAITSIAIEFRYLIFLGIEFIFQFAVIIFQSVIRRILYLPGLIKRFFQLVKDGFIWFWGFLGRAGYFLKFNTYIIGFGSSGVLGFLALFKKDDIFFASAILMVIVSLAILLLQKPVEVVDRISQVQQLAYQRSLVARRLVFRAKSYQCPTCEDFLSRSQNHCYRCDNDVPRCSVCKGFIYAESETHECPNCQQIGHADHLIRWLQIRSICPHCRRDWT